MYAGTYGTLNDAHLAKDFLMMMLQKNARTTTYYHGTEHGGAGNVHGRSEKLARLLTLKL